MLIYWYFPPACNVSAIASQQEPLVHFESVHIARPQESKEQKLKDATGVQNAPATVFLYESLSFKRMPPFKVPLQYK